MRRVTSNMVQHTATNGVVKWDATMGLNYFGITANRLSEDLSTRGSEHSMAVLGEGKVPVKGLMTTSTGVATDCLTAASLCHLTTDCDSQRKGLVVGIKRGLLHVRRWQEMIEQWTHIVRVLAPCGIVVCGGALFAHLCVCLCTPNP